MFEFSDLSFWKSLKKMSGVVSALEFENAIPLDQMLLLTKDEKSDLGFAFGELVAFFLKKNLPVIFITLSQSFNHYCHVLMKFGVNMKALTESGQIVNIDVLKLTGHLLRCGGEVPDDCNSLISILSPDLKTNSLKAFYAFVRETVGKLCAQYRGQSEGFVLFIDELNVLLNLGIADVAVQHFVHYCYNLCSANPEFHGCLIIGAQDDPQDPECHQLLTYFAHNAHIRVKVQGLSTGYSNDVHGKILIENKSRSDNRIQKMLFKVEDKGAKLFPLGL